MIFEMFLLFLANLLIALLCIFANLKARNVWIKTITLVFVFYGIMGALAIITYAAYQVLQGI